MNWLQYHGKIAFETHLSEYSISIFVFFPNEHSKSIYHFWFGCHHFVCKNQTLKIQQCFSAILTSVHLLNIVEDYRLHKMMWNLGASNERQLSNDSLTTGWNSLDWCSWWWLWSNQNCIWISCRKLQLSKLYQCFHMCVSWHYMLCMTKLYGSHILIASSSNQEIRQCHYQCQCLIQYIWIVKYIYVQNPLHLMCGNFVANENRIA